MKVRCRGKWFHRFVPTGEWQRFLCNKCGAKGYWNGYKFVIAKAK